MNRDTSASLATLLVAGMTIIIALLILLTMPAPAAAVCLTKKEARHLWPRQHIYWYSKDHCWSNRHGPPRNLQFDPIDPVFPKRAMAKAPEEASADNDHCCWPALDYDPNGNVIEPPRTFESMWNDQPWVR